MARDDTAALVVALSAQLTKFEQDMNKAVGIADKSVKEIEDKFSKANPTFAGTFAGSFLGSFLSNLPTKALEAITKQVDELVKRFIDLEKISAQTGISMRQAFAIQETFKATPVEQVNTAIKNISISIDEMQRGIPNGLSKLLDANKAKIDLLGFNKETLTAQQTLLVLAEIMKGFSADPIRRTIAARMAGIDENLIATLSQGAAVLKKMMDDAEKGAPDFKKIAESTRAFAETWEAISRIGTDFFKDQSIVFFRNTLVEVATLIALIAKGLAAFKGIPLFDTLGAQEAAKYLKEQAAEIDAKIAQIRGERPAAEPAPGEPGAPTTRIRVNALGGPSRLPPPPASAEARTAFDREIERITRHTEQINADTRSMFANTAVHAQLRAEFQLLNAARLTNKNITSDQIAEYERLRSEGIEPLIALERAHIKLSEDQANKLLSASERAKTATANYAAAAQKLQDINQLSSTLGSALSSAFADAVVEGKKLNEVLASLIKTLEKAAINQLFASFFQPRGGAATSIFGSLFAPSAGGAAAAPNLNITGSLYQTGTDFARGGVAMVGEAGPELVRLPTGAQVIPNDVLKSIGGNAGSIIYSPAIDARGASVEAVARLAQVLEQDRRTFTARTVDVIQRARRSRIPGI
jgi:hypothetical protein